jgi:glycosyltransferase involved in cell wall biosynthesis
LKKTKVAIIIPAFNESSVIHDVVNNIDIALMDYDNTIIVVNDGSKDETALLAQKAGALVISHVLNSGSGAATSTGIAYAKRNNFDFAATIDADGQHDPEDLKKILKRLQDDDAPDLIIGSRLIDSNGMSATKVLGNKGLSFVTMLLFGVNVTDSQSGLRGFSKKALQKLNLRTQGYEFCSEMLWRAKQQNLFITEIPIKAIYTDYSKSKGQNNWNAFMIIRSLIQRRLLEFIGE